MFLHLENSTQKLPLFLVRVLTSVKVVAHLCVCVCVHVCICLKYVYVYAGVNRGQENVRSPGAGVIGVISFLEI